MGQIDFSVYEVKNSLEKVLFLLVEKIYNTDQSCVIHSALRDRLQSYDQMLWTFKKISFIPHMMSGENLSEYNKILLADDLSIVKDTWENAIFLDNYSAYNSLKITGKAVFLFHENDKIAEEELYKALSGHSFKHFKEKKDGSWERISH